MVTVRSEEKGRRILDNHPNVPKEKLSYVIVEDVAKEGAFDEVSLSHSGAFLVIHSKFKTVFRSILRRTN